MKTIALRLPLVAACLLLFVNPLAAQDDVGRHDSQRALMTRPFREVQVLPAKCENNEVVILTTQPTGSNARICDNSNNWTVFGSATGSVDLTPINNAIAQKLDASALPAAIAGKLDASALPAAIAGKLDASQKGANSGVAALDGTGKVACSSLPGGCITIPTTPCILKIGTTGADPSCAVSGADYLVSLPSIPQVAFTTATTATLTATTQYTHIDCYSVSGSTATNFLPNSYSINTSTLVVSIDFGGNSKTGYCTATR